jgi:hypothetical protein
MRAKAFYVAGVAALLAGALVPAASAGGGPKPQPLPETQALALINAPAAIPSGSVTRAVSMQEALAAASLPGASVSLAPGLSLQQAVGLAPERSTSAVRRSAYTGCSANAAWHEWGLWPYQQRLTDTTYWCAVYGDHITYTSSTTSGSGTLCGTDWTSSQIVSGGVGYSWFVTRSQAGFSCPTVIPWITLHPSHYLDVSRNAWGSTAVEGSG